MPNLLWHFVRDVLTEVGELQEGVATGGSATTLVDSLLGGADDDWKSGTLIITRDAAGLGAVPEGEFAIPTGYAESSGTITFASGDISTPAVGDIYGVATDYYPLRQVIRAINRGLQAMGDVPQVDTTTLDTVSDQTEYAASVEWKRHPPYRVDVQLNTGNPNDNRWKPLEGWDYVPAVAGDPGLIVLPYRPISSRDIRVWFEDAHTAVEAFDDEIYEGFYPERILWESVNELLTWKNGLLSGQDDNIRNQLNHAGFKREESKNEFVTWKPKNRTKILTLDLNRRNRHYPGEYPGNRY